MIAPTEINARVAFSDSGPWDLPTGGVKLGDRIYQESYSWPQWVSYKQAARAKKFSRYQFRAPGEWFAEAYATYCQPPGDKGALMKGLDDKTRTWNKKGTAQMSTTEQDTAVAQRAIAQELQVADTAVKVRPLRVTVPGITVFTAAVDPGKAGRHASRTGIVEGGAIHTGSDAISRRPRVGLRRQAHGAGGDRGPGVRRAPQLHGRLRGDLDDDTAETYKKVSGPKRAAAVALPAEATVDDLPAVVYCLTSSARGTPFSVITAIVKPDFKVELRVQPVLED